MKEHPSINIFKHFLLWNHWANQTQISYGGSLGRGNESLFKNGPGHMTKMAATPIYGKKPFKNQSSPEPEGRWPWDLVCSIGDVGSTKFVQKTYLMSRSNLPPNAFKRIFFEKLNLCSLKTVVALAMILTWYV